MDKYEYRMKAEQIEKLVKKKDYKTAAKISDTIDWRRVKNLNMLYVVSEVYEQMERYEDCMEILNIAYDRAPVGRMLVYKMTEIATKMHQFDEAIELYREFVRLAPHDQSRYILKYQIYRERGSSVEDQITILNDYKTHEYQEQWAYELAARYAEAGRIEECVRECDELILWFSEGEYVIKAMELKMQYEPLSAAQQDQYDHRFHASGKSLVNEDDFEETKVTEYNTDKFSTVNLQAELAANLDELFQEEQPVELETLNVDEPSVELEELSIEEPSVELEELSVEEPSVELEELSVEEPSVELEELSVEEPSVELEDLAVEEPASEPEESAVEPIADPEEPETEAPKMEEIGIELEDLAIKEPTPELEELSIEEPAVEPEELSIEEPAIEPEELSVEEVEPNLEEPVIDEIGIELEDLAIEEPKAPVVEELPMEPKASAEEPAAVEPIADPEEAEPEEEKQITGQLSIEDILAEWESKKAETEALLEAGAEKAKARKAVVQQRTVDLVKLIAGGTEELPSDVRELLDEIEQEKKEQQESAKDAAAETITEDDLPQDVEEEEAAVLFEDLDVPDDTVTTEKAKKSPVSDDTASMNMIQELERTLAGEVSEMAVNSGHLTREQARLFAYFTSVRGMSQQLAEIFADRPRANKTNSSSGNLVVTGKRGNGKTTLAISIVKAMQKQQYIEGKRLAKISAQKLNTKDIFEIVSKLKGGALIVESAGELSDAAIMALGVAMEGDTRGMLVILEDSAEEIERIFALNRHFAEKFEHTIEIPDFSNDELIAFGKSYAMEQEYVLDEFGVLALYDRVGSLQTNTHLVTVTDVKEIVDEAIAHAEKGSMRHLIDRLTKKNIDEFGNHLLREEDFIQA